MHKRNGFTLIELLVVIAIIALLVSILMPSLSKAKNLAKVAVCGSNMHNVGAGANLYVGECNTDEPFSRCNGYDLFWEKPKCGTGSPDWSLGNTNPATPNTPGSWGNPAVGLTLDFYDPTLLGYGGRTSDNILASQKCSQNYVASADMLFCPLFKVNYKENYSRYGEGGQIGAPLAPGGRNERAWGTAIWMWPKKIATPVNDPAKVLRPGAVNNSTSNDVLMADFFLYGAQSPGFWTDQELGSMKQALYHYNVLTLGGAVRKFSKVRDVEDYLWLGQPSDTRTYYDPASQDGGNFALPTGYNVNTLPGFIPG